MVFQSEHAENTQFCSPLLGPVGQQLKAQALEPTCLGGTEPPGSIHCVSPGGLQNLPSQECCGLWTSKGRRLGPGGVLGGGLGASPAPFLHTGSHQQ